MLVSLLRAIGAVAAGVWLGGIIVIAIVAQTTFRVMPTTGVAQPNAVAGQVMARTFGRFDVVQMICCGLLLATQIAFVCLVGGMARDWLRLAILLGAAGLLAYNVFVLTPKITNLQPLLQASDPEAAIKTVFAGFHDTAVRNSKILLVMVLALAVELASPRGTRRMLDNGIAPMPTSPTVRAE